MVVVISYRIHYSWTRLQLPLPFHHMPKRTAETMTRHRQKEVRVITVHMSGTKPLPFSHTSRGFERPDIIPCSLEE